MAQFSEGQSGLEVGNPARIAAYQLLRVQGPLVGRKAAKATPIGKPIGCRECHMTAWNESMVGRKRGGALDLQMRAAATDKQFPKTKSQA
jgi:hypothetical protein